MPDAADAGKALAEFSPQHEPYKQLKAALAQMRGKGAGAGKMLAEGELLKLNAKAPMEDPRVPLLRDKLGIAGDASDLKYDAKLAEAVKKFQRANELPATGNLDARTVKELNGPPRDDRSISSSPIWSAGAGIRATSARPMSLVEPAGLLAQGHARRQSGLDHADRDRQDPTCRRRCSARQ